MANQLREHLKRVFPAALGLFEDLDSPISLKFLTRFDCQDRADWLTPKRLDGWLKSVRYTGHSDPAILHARLLAAPRGATGEDGAAYAGITHALVATLSSLVAQINTLSKRIGEQLASHADAHIFTSLPRSGTIRAARLLAEIVTAAPDSPPPKHNRPGRRGALTRQSGKRSVSFRWACDNNYRAVCDFANDSRHANPWPPTSTTAPVPQHDHPHATRILARACSRHLTVNNTPHPNTLHPHTQPLTLRRANGHPCLPETAVAGVTADRLISGDGRVVRWLEPVPIPA